MCNNKVCFFKDALLGLSLWCVCFCTHTHTHSCSVFPLSASVRVLVLLHREYEAFWFSEPAKPAVYCLCLWSLLTWGQMTEACWLYVTYVRMYVRPHVYCMSSHACAHIWSPHAGTISSACAAHLLASTCCGMFPGYVRMCLVSIQCTYMLWHVESAYGHVSRQCTCCNMHMCPIWNPHV